MELLKRESTIKWFNQKQWLAEKPSETDRVIAPKHTVEIGTQTEVWYKGYKRLTDLKEIANWKDWKQYADSEWQEHLCKITEVRKGNPIASGVHMQVVFEDSKDEEMEKSVQSLYRERYPEIVEMKERFKIIELITRTRNTERKPTRGERAEFMGYFGHWRRNRREQKS